MPDQIRAAVAVQRAFIEGRGQRDELRKLIARYANANLYRHPAWQIESLRHRIIREVSRKYFPAAHRIGAASAKPVLEALAGRWLAEKGVAGRGKVLAGLKRHTRLNLRALQAALKGEGAKFSAEVEAAFLRAQRDGIARGQLVADLVKADKAELKSLAEAYKRLDDTAGEVAGAEKRLARAPKGQRGKPAAQLREAKKELRKAKASARGRKGFLARFETYTQARVRDAVRREVQEAQFAEFRKQGHATFTWVAVNGADACPSCVSRHGQTATAGDWRGRGPGEGDTVCGAACMCQLVPAAYTEGNPALAEPIRV